MAHTVARVLVNGTGFRIVGADKETVTNVTVDTNSEVVTAAELGLNTIYSAQALIDTGVATDTGVYVKATVASSGASVTIAQFAAAGTAATTAAGTIIRVTAKGY